MAPSFLCNSPAMSHSSNESNPAFPRDSRSQTRSERKIKEKERESKVIRGEYTKQGD
jgi:hypothetical protein